MSQPVIDAHSHILVAEAEALAAQLKPRYPSGSGADFQGEESRDVNREKFSEFKPGLMDLKTKLSDMDRMGIDLSVLSASPVSYHAWTEGEDAVRLSRIQNEAMTEMATKHPDRFAALATLPLQDVTLGIAELEHAVKALGHKGTMIQTNFRGRDLDHPVYEPFYAKLEELDVPLFLHPNDVAGHERYQDYYLTNLIGNPWADVAGRRVRASPEVKGVPCSRGWAISFYPRTSGPRLPGASGNPEACAQGAERLFESSLVRYDYPLGSSTEIFDRDGG
jgi:aminocarboxymuconate-semialdehyde decarboxylase